MHLQYLIEDQSSTELISALMEKIITIYQALRIIARAFVALEDSQRKILLKKRKQVNC